LISGWRFHLRPLTGGPLFKFLAFRSPQDGGRFRIWPIEPNFDAHFGHKPHMITTTVGGQKVPVLCGPGGRAAATLAEARLYAAKWAVYTARSLREERTWFSE
jgi:hypothetical protein